MWQYIRSIRIISVNIIIYCAFFGVCFAQLLLHLILFGSEEQILIILIILINRNGGTKMANQALDKRLEFKRDWVVDLPPWIVDYLGEKQLINVAVLQLRAQHAMLKAQEELVEEVIKIYSNASRQ